MPPPIVPVAGLVTVTITVPGVAIAEAGTMAASWFAVTYVVFCCVPPIFTTAVVPKPLPLTVKVKPGPPDATALGISCVIVGTTPGVGAAAIGLLYPHPRLMATSDSTQINFMGFSSECCYESSDGERRECQAGVISL
jgi:hypothetical protein